MKNRSNIKVKFSDVVPQLGEGATVVPVEFRLADELGMLTMDAIVVSGVGLTEIGKLLATTASRGRLVHSLAEAFRERASGARRLEALIGQSFLLGGGNGSSWFASRPRA